MGASPTRPARIPADALRAAALGFLTACCGAHLIGVAALLASAAPLLVGQGFLLAAFASLGATGILLACYLSRHGPASRHGKRCEGREHVPATAISATTEERAP